MADRIIKWYNEKSDGTYMDDMGSWIKEDTHYLSGGIEYVQEDFWKLMEEMCIPKDEVFIMED